MSKFHETSWLYCLLKVAKCALVTFNQCVFQVDVMSWKSRVSCKIPIFTNI